MLVFTTGMGFSNSADNNRKRFTGYERDTETGLDFAQARYFSNLQGRFTSPDPFSGSAITANPQTFNRYSYCDNNPVNMADPSGLKGRYAPVLGASNFSAAVGGMFRGNGGNSVEDDLARYEQNLAVTYAAINEANFLNSAMASGAMSSEEAEFRAAYNPMLDVVVQNPQNPSPTVDSEYQRCRNQVFGQGATTYAGKDIPGQHQTGLMFLAGRANPNDSAMIAALWANESNFEETPAKDAGPAQLTSWWTDNHPELIQDNAYGSWHGRTTKHFDGNVQDNIETLGNIVRFSVQRYGNYPAVAYWYGPGDPNNAKNAAKNRTNYSNEAMSRYAKYQEFFNCLPH